ncbi:hypothetical protein Btru_019757 [Bulinus truncatus]|nr:hypothetical protein Btru_019757 [Bulinus truncatus]
MLIASLRFLSWTPQYFVKKKMKIFFPVKVGVFLAVTLKLVCADWTSLINAYSSICQLSINSSASALYTAGCSTVTATQEPYLAVVKLGFCTEQEFNNLTATVCGRSNNTKPDSTAKLNFYNALNLIDVDCKIAFVQSISNSVTAIVFKQQEMYCQLSSLIIEYVNSRNKYPHNCYSYKYSSVLTATCPESKTDVDQKFSTAILSTTSSTCQNKISTCASTQTIQMVVAMQYCEYLNSEEVGTSTKSCLRLNNACTLSEIVELQDTACDAKTSVISTFSSACRVTIRLKAPNLHTADCNAVSASQEKYLTLVKFGFCTEKEFQTLSIAACGSSSSTKTDSASKLNFYNALNQVSIKCQQQSLTCFNNTVNAIVLKQQEQYCSLMNLELNSKSTEDCLKPDCTYEEFLKLQSAACSVSKTDVDQTFSKAMLGMWSTCQNRISRCGVISPQTKQFVMKMQYCEAMSVLEVGNTTETCLELNNECTSAEFARLKEAACASNVMSAAWSLTSSSRVDLIATVLNLSLYSFMISICHLAVNFLLIL